MTRIPRSPSLSLRLLLTLACVCGAASAAIADPGTSSLANREGPALWIASGPEGGTYRSVYATNLEALMRGNRIFYRETEGSAQNIELMQAGEADIAFVQADVFAAAWQAGETSGVQVIGRISDECLYIAYRKGGRIQQFEHLKSPPDGEPARIAVGPDHSGPAGSWRWFSERVPELAGNETSDQVGTLALNQLALGRYDAVVWVTDPGNLDHKMLQGTLSNDALGIMPVTDAGLLAPLADGTVIYRKRKVTLSGGWKSKKVETICTSALVLMRRDADRQLVDRISDLVSLKRDLIAPHD